MNRRVVITGIGVVAPNGIGKEEFWEALENGRSGIKNATIFDASSFPNQAVGEITDFRMSDFTHSKRLLKTGRLCQLSLSAAYLALEDAGFKKEGDYQVNKYRKGVAFATAFPAIDIFKQEVQTLLEKKIINHDQMNNFYSLCSSNAITMELVRESGFDDYVFTINTACTSGLETIFYAADQIASNRADIYICGGADAFLNYVMQAAFFAAGISAQSEYDSAEAASRPFDMKRSGGVNSEGSAMVILEDSEGALTRGANIYGEISGYSVYPKKRGKDEAQDIILGIEMSIRAAIERSGISKEEIDYISAHAPSLPVFDKLETIALKHLFGNHAYKIPISSIKSMIGNPMAAAGPMQLASVLLAINKDVIPPTINYDYPDPDCDLDYVPNFARKNKINHALIETHGLDGTNAVLIVKRYIE